MSTNWLLFATNLLAIALGANLLVLAIAVAFVRKLKHKTRTDTTHAMKLLSMIASSESELPLEIKEQLQSLSSSAVKMAVISSVSNFRGRAREKILREPAINLHIERSLSDLGSHFWWRRLSAARFLHIIISPEESIPKPSTAPDKLFRILAARWVSPLMNEPPNNTAEEKTSEFELKSLQRRQSISILSTTNPGFGEISDDHQMIESLTKLLDHSDWDTRHTAAQALANLGSPGLLVLRMATRRSSASGRRMATHVLEKRSLDTSRGSHAA